MAEEKNRFYLREFLNKEGHHTTAVVYAGVDDEGHPWLHISDCSRQISLSLDTYNEEERSNTLYKLELLLYAVTELLHYIGDDAFYEQLQRERAAKDATWAAERAERLAQRVARGNFTDVL